MQNDILGLLDLIEVKIVLYIITNFYNEKNKTNKHRLKPEIRSFSISHIKISPSTGRATDCDVYVDDSISKYVFICSLKWAGYTFVGDNKTHHYDIKNINHIVRYQEYIKKDIAANDLKLITPSTYQDIANDFLFYNYPEALYKNSRIQIKKLANNMNLTIVRCSYSDNKSVLARVYVNNCGHDKNYVSNDTITVYLKSSDKITNIFIQACVIKYIISKYKESCIELKSDYIDIRRDCINDTNVDAVGFINILSKKIADRVVLTDDAFLERINHILVDYTQHEEMSLNPDKLADILNDVSNYSGMTPNDSKERLVDAGYNEFRGINVNIDGSPVKPFIYPKTFKKFNTTFCIPLEALKRLYNTDEKLQKLIYYGAYIYIESHLCVNSSKYIENATSQNLSLNEYARTHMSECCISFIVNDQFCNYYSEKFFTANSYITWAVKGEQKDDIREKCKKTDEFIKHIFEQSKNNDSESNRAKSIIELVLNELEICQTAASLFMNVTEGAFSRAIFKKTRNTLNYLILFCVSLHLIPQVSKAIIEVFGYNLEDSLFESDRVYWEAITLMYSSVDECNRRLKKNGCASLPKKAKKSSKNKKSQKDE